MCYRCVSYFPLQVICAYPFSTKRLHIFEKKYNISKKNTISVDFFFAEIAFNINKYFCNLSIYSLSPFLLYCNKISKIFFSPKRQFIRTKRQVSHLTFLELITIIILNSQKGEHTLKILLVENDSIQLTALKNILVELLPDSLVDTASTYEDAVSLIQTRASYDIFYLDIALNNESDNSDGLSIGKFIRNTLAYKTTPIVFVTSFTDKITYAINNLHCYSYLVKPYTHDDVANSLRDIIDSGLIKEKPISFKNIDGIIFKILPSDIVHICSENHGITVFTNSYNFNTRFFSLDSILGILPQYFIRCHRKHIINMKMVSNYDKTTNMLQISGSAIPVGRNYKSVFEERFNNI